MRKFKVPKFTEDQWDWIEIIFWSAIYVICFGGVIILAGYYKIPPPF